jgi:hypothetical protein
MAPREQIESAAHFLATRASKQPVRHLAFLYQYSADALRTALGRPEADMLRDVASVATGLAMAVRGSPEASDIGDLPMTLGELSELASIGGVQ